ncbi:flagellar synthesis regulator flen [hydrocarbon metagenome]|uniref:Flagellar synthesis regulator flen n=1 Tax=hydrocarbon metagenome TaxID=938273 RepID=A0A0W8E4N0_9ZZZZ
MSDQADKLRKMASSIRQQIEVDLMNKAKQTRVIVISSGKGGVGKSTIALNIALVLGTYNKKVILMDADMGLANIDIMLGLIPKYTIQHVVQGRKKLKDVMIDGPAGVKIIPGGSGINELADLNDNELNRLIQELSKIDGEYDYMIIDTGAGISRNVVSFLLAADDVIMVTTAEPTSLTDAYGTVKTMIKQAYAGKIYLLVNKVTNNSEGIMVAEKFRIACKRFLDTDLIAIGNVVNEPAVREGIMRQEAFTQMFPQSTATRNIVSIVDRLMTGYDVSYSSPGQPGGVKSFFRKLSSLFRDKDAGVG